MEFVLQCIIIGANDHTFEIRNIGRGDVYGHDRIQHHFTHDHIGHHRRW